MDLFLYEKIGITLLRQRRSEDGSGWIRVRMNGTRGDVHISPAAWDELERQFREEVRPSARTLWTTLLWAIPMALALTVLIANVPLLGRIDALLPVPLPLLLANGMVLTLFVRHLFLVQRAIDRAEASLRSLPRTREPRHVRERRALNVVEIAAILLLGPHLIIQAWGSLNPQAFRNTPWTGAHLDCSGWAGLAVLVLLFGLRLRGPRRAALPEPADTVDGRASVIARRARAEHAARQG